MLFWQYRMDSTRLTQLAQSAIEPRLVQDLQIQANRIAQQAAPRLAPALVEVSRWEDAHAVGAELLRLRNVAGVEIRSVRGDIVFSQLRPSAEGLVEAEQQVVGAPRKRDAQPPVLGTVKVSLSRDAAISAVSEVSRQVESERRSSFLRQLGLLGAVCAVLIVAGLVAGWLIAGRIERPITALIKSADRIGQGDYTRPLAIAAQRRDRRPAAGARAHALQAAPDHHHQELPEHRAQQHERRGAGHLAGRHDQGRQRSGAPPARLRRGGADRQVASCS